MCGPDFSVSVRCLLPVADLYVPGDDPPVPPAARQRGERQARLPPHAASLQGPRARLEGRGRGDKYP